MVDRIKQVMEHYEETPAGFAEKIGVNRSNLTHVFSGRNQPSLDFAKKVLLAFPEVSTEWLIMGVGNMIKDPMEITPARRTFVQTDLFGTVEETINERVTSLSNNITDEIMEDNPTPPADIPIESVPSAGQEISSENSMKKIDTEHFESVQVPIITAPESNISRTSDPVTVKNDSQPVEKLSGATENNQLETNKGISGEKKIEKIIFFYDDDSFKVYHP